MPSFPPITIAVPGLLQSRGIMAFIKHNYSSPSPGNDAFPAVRKPVKPLGTSGVEGSPKILIGICSCQFYAHKRKAVRDTWLNTMPPGITALFFAGEGEEEDESGLLQLPCPDDYQNLPCKVQHFYRYALAHCDFDYIFKCDDDTYVHTSRLLELPVPGVDFIGGTDLYSQGCANGGAGYLMTREMVKLFAREPIAGQGAEDKIFSSLALASGLKVDVSAQLHMGHNDPPTPDNSVITAHWCDPARMHSIHDELSGKGPESVLKLRAIHPGWSGPLILYADGKFRGGNINPHGTWRAAQSGDILILQWAHWPAETLRRQPWGFEGASLRLEAMDPMGMDQWDQIQSLPALRPLTQARVAVEYSCRLGNQLFQFAAGWVLAKRAGVPLSAPPIPGFPGTEGFDFGRAVFQPLRTAEVSEMHMDFERCLKHLHAGKDIVVNGYHQRYELLRANKQELRDLLQPLENLPADLTPGEEDMVAHVRLGDYFPPNFTTAYAYSLEDMRQLIEKRSFHRLWVITDSPDDPFIKKLQSDLNARVPKMEPLLDFAIMLAAKRLIISPSTFSWWAAWLGEAREIYFPDGKGAWKEKKYNLWVDDEKRYIAY